MREKINIHRVFWYFLIFSIIGLAIETFYCYFTTGVLESRKGLIWGPFCPVYGVGAALLMCVLGKYENKGILKLFVYGIVVGSISEYVLSYGLEAIYSIRFWEYSYTRAHLNGRICLIYSLYWGILSVILVKICKPVIDKLINKINIKLRNILEIVIFIFLTIDCFATIWGISTYENRLINGTKNKTNGNYFLELKQIIEENYFTNERMLKTFPNLRTKDSSGNEIWLKDLV